MSVDERIKNIIAQQFNVDASKLRPETSFVGDLMAESIDTVELIAAFEEEFNLEIPDEEAEKNQTVGQTIEYVKRKLAEHR